MSNNTIGGPELFSLLESNKPNEVDEIKTVLHEHFLSTKDNWLVNGLFEYYLSTNSNRAVDVLAKVREPHDKHLLDRLYEALAKPSNQGQKLLTLTLLGHVSRRQPTWLFKLANHPLFKELLKLLKTEGETLSLMSALLLLVTLLPMIPGVLGPHLHDIFEVFARLVTFYYNQASQLSLQNSTSVEWDRIYFLHLQVGLYSLFHRLYAMYPCNFVYYLQQQYQRDSDPTFFYTVQPMLESVKMHPLLITTSKDAEISQQRWKKMEHHDVVAECDKYTIDRKNQEEIIVPTKNARFTPNPDYPYSGSDTIGDDDTFWSPSMLMPPHSPSILQTQPHEIRSTPSTPGNKSRTSPPEAAVEATPETTPVKDSRQIPSRQPMSNSAVRALGAFGNGVLGVNSRPSTPNSVISSNFTFGGGDNSSITSSILSQKLEKVESDRFNFQSPKSKNVSNIKEKLSEADVSQNGKNDSWQEDQEILEIVNARGRGNNASSYLQQRLQMNDCVKNKNVQRFFPISQSQTTKLDNSGNNEKLDCIEQNASRLKKTEEIGTQTLDFIPYEHLLKDICNKKNQEASSESPAILLDRYIETCVGTNSSSDCNRSRSSVSKIKQRKRGGDDDQGDENVEDDGLHHDCINQLQLVQMLLQFERQRREVLAERNRRLFGKMRDSRVSEEHTVALNDRLRILDAENSALKTELDRSKAEIRSIDERCSQALQHWQSKCVEEQQQNQTFKDKIEALEIELKSERKKLSEGERQMKSLESDLFTAGNQLKETLKTVNYAEELQKKLCTIKKQFLLFREAQMRIQQERTDIYTKEAKEETVEMLQKSYAEELLSLRKQVENGKALVEAFRNRLGELENKEARKENQINDQQRLLLEAKERHESELQAVESKYKAQMEINLLLQCKILELNGKLETENSQSGSVTNLMSSCSPQPSSSVECNIQYNTSGTINDYNDSAGEILNLHAIIESRPSQIMTSTRSNQHR
ncbi:hamartin [Leptopilina heterotoma]|uniref:hamartin n=1 Tax=Leptopilina heterotoma TaxID=63436 RepID=UPI001CA7F514|nr:hamartin [Leptopilina heterotoma]